MVEVVREGSRRGFVLMVEARSPHHLREIIADASDVMARWPAEHRASNVPGVVALAIGSAAMLEGVRVELLRDIAAAQVDAQVVCPPGRVAELVRPWPLVHMSGRVLDVRGDAALSLGPSDDDARRYARWAGMDSSPHEIQRLFELGVLRWSEDEGRDGYRMLEPA